MIRSLVAAVLLAVLLSVSGCAANLISKALENGQALTPEQVEAYNKVGLDTYSCLKISGPPPSGVVVIITVPRTQPGRGINFSENCQVVR